MACGYCGEGPYCACCKDPEHVEALEDVARLQEKVAAEKTRFALLQGVLKHQRALLQDAEVAVRQERGDDYWLVKGIRAAIDKCPGSAE